jgi:transposase
VVDHFHAIRLANAVVDQVRRRTQQATLGHRGRTHDPLYRIRKLLLTAAEQLTERGRVRLCDGVGVAELSRLARTVRAWEAEVLAFHTTGGCSNGPTEALTCCSRRSSALGMASATSPITACGCCCTAASPGRLTRPQDYEGAPHAW